MKVSTIDDVIGSTSGLPFSGVVLVQQRDKPLAAKAYGLANRSTQIANTLHTRFGMASGCKIFTAIAVCQLVDRQELSFETLLRDCLKDSIFQFDTGITIHQLLTHSSGMPDYFDEEWMVDYEALWRERPMYNMRRPADFLVMFQDRPMKFVPGERFGYCNAGFIVLGYLVEQVTGMPFTQYVENHIFAACGMTDSGYLAMDQLPERCAQGYIDDRSNGTWRTNIYSVPIVGGPDGGAYTTAYDMEKFWGSLFANRLLEPQTTAKMLTPHLETEEHPDLCYGYGVWLRRNGQDGESYYVEGEDPGVQFVSAAYPQAGAQITMIGNSDLDIIPLFRKIEMLVLRAA